MKILLSPILDSVLISILLWLLLAPSGRAFLKSAEAWFPFTRLISSWSKGIAIAMIVITAIIAGHVASAQVTPPFSSLKSVPVPEPDNLADFVKNKTAAIALGKAFFWDMQVGSDGILACASCHFQAGVDNRSKNQLAPGLLRMNANRSPNPDTVVNKGGLNYELKPEDYPFHKLTNPNNRASKVLADTNDVTSSQGVFNAVFKDVVPGNAQDVVTYQPDPAFNVEGTNVRRVEPRNTPTVINTVYNFRNFWDGRAQNDFNGVNPFGSRDPNAKVYKAVTSSKLQEVKISLNNSSLASVSVGPPLSSFEMSADGRTFTEIGDKFGSIDHKSNSAAKGKKLPKKLGKKLLPLQPLGKQIVASDDSVLGSESLSPQPGLKTSTYEKLIEAAFKDDWWKSNRVIQINPTDGSRTVIKKPDRDLMTQEYTLMEYNFSLFFGLSVQSYLATLVANDTPFDQFLDGNASALTNEQKQGFQIFQTKGLCINCHGGPELTNTSVSSVEEEPLDRMEGTAAIYDNGFNNTGVRPTLEDLGIGDVDPFGNPLSLSRLAQRDGEIDPNEPVVADGGFKVPGLRNVELTPPYFHNGGQLTLEQVVEFYNRGGDFNGLPDLDPDIQKLGLTVQEKADLVAFLKGLTDERVRYQKAPFDHPQLFIPNGHPGDENSVTNDGSGKATDSQPLLEIPAVGRNGGTPLPTFLATSATAGKTARPAAASYPPGAGYTEGDCPAGTTVQPLPGGFVCQ
jgi:cytochrome c peroxidase